MAEHLFKIRLPFHLPQHKLQPLAMSMAGFFYALGFWLLVDASIYSKSLNASKVHVTFIDWIPFICSTFGTVIVNSLNKVQLINSDMGFDTSSGLQWQARVVLFVGFALLAVGLSGSILVLVLKFIVKGFTSMPTVGMGLENIFGNIFVMTSCCLLWFVSNMEEDNSLAL